MTTPNGRRRIEYVLLRDVKPAKRNPKNHDDDALDASIDRFGYTEPTLLDERTGRLVAGHGRLERLLARQAAGDDPPDGIVATRDGWKIPVVRGWSSKNDREAEAYLIASNRLVETGGWDLGDLSDLLADVADSTGVLDGIGFDTADLNRMLDDLHGSVDHDHGDATDDEPPGPADDPISAPGDLWFLGRHRVLCGDSSDGSVIERLMDGQQAGLVWTDPPYGVNYVGKTADALTIENDALDGDALEALLTDAFTASSKVCRPGAVWMVAAPPGPQLLSFLVPLNALGIWRQSLVWVKHRFVLGHSDYHYRHEMLLFGWQPGGGSSSSADSGPRLGVAVSRARSIDGAPDHEADTADRTCDPHPFGSR